MRAGTRGRFSRCAGAPRPHATSADSWRRCRRSVAASTRGGAPVTRARTGASGASVPSEGPERRGPTGLPPVSGPRRSVSPAQGMPLVPHVSAARSAFRSESLSAAAAAISTGLSTGASRPAGRGGTAGDQPVGLTRPASGAAPRRSRSARAAGRRRTPTGASRAASGSGTTTTRIRAALAEMAPLKESSTARQPVGSTPSLAAVDR